jgi:hypothetical protein
MASAVGSTRAPRVAIGALADGILQYSRKCMRFKDVAGGGVCSPACFAAAISEHLGRLIAGCNLAQKLAVLCAKSGVNDG